MRIVTALSFTAGLALLCCQPAIALPVDGSLIQQAAAAGSSLQQAQYSERRTKRGVVKCYREFVVGNYVCHRYRNW